MNYLLYCARGLTHTKWPNKCLESHEIYFQVQEQIKTLNMKLEELRLEHMTNEASSESIISCLNDKLAEVCSMAWLWLMAFIEFRKCSYWFLNLMKVKCPCPSICKILLILVCIKQNICQNDTFLLNLIFCKLFAVRQMYKLFNSF